MDPGGGAAGGDKARKTLKLMRPQGRWDFEADEKLRGQRKAKPREPQGGGSFFCWELTSPARAEASFCTEVFAQRLPRRLCPENPFLRAFFRDPVLSTF